MVGVESWRPVCDWEGLYEVSDAGRVRSVDRIVVGVDGKRRRLSGRVRVARTKSDGHCQVHLSRPGFRKQASVHVLVLCAFIGLRPEGAIARHLNGDPADNRLENLAWGTYSENVHDQVRHGTHYCAGKTHCARGHEYLPENTYFYHHRKGIARHCRACNRDAVARRTQRLRADLEAPA